MIMDNVDALLTMCNVVDTEFFKSNSLRNMMVALLFVFQGMVLTVASGWPQVLLSSF